MASLNLPSVNINPGVIQGGSLPDPLTQFLAALAQGQEVGMAKMRERGMNSRSSAENELARARIALDAKKIELDIAKERRETAAAEAEGKAIHEILKAVAPQQAALGQFNGPMGGQQTPRQPMPRPEGGSSPQGMPPMSAPQPRAAPPPTPPMEVALQVLQQVPDEVKPDVWKQMAPVLTAAQAKYMQEAAARERAMVQARILTTVHPRHRGAVEAFMSWDMIGERLPKEMVDVLYPELAGAAPEYTPEVIGKLYDNMRKSGKSFGFEREAAKLPPHPSVPDSLVLPEVGGDALKIQEAANFYVTGLGAQFDLLRLNAVERGLNVTADMLRGASGLDVIDALKRWALADATTPEQKQLIQANIAFIQMARFWMSGQQSGLGERGDFLLQFVEFGFDDDQTRAQKAASRELLLMGIEIMASKRLTRKQVISMIANNPLLTPAQQEWMKANAVDDEAEWNRITADAKWRKGATPSSAASGAAGRNIPDPP